MPSHLTISFLGGGDNFFYYFFLHVFYIKGHCIEYSEYFKLLFYIEKHYHLQWHIQVYFEMYTIG